MASRKFNSDDAEKISRHRKIRVTGNEQEVNLNLVITAEDLNAAFPEGLAVKSTDTRIVTQEDMERFDYVVKCDPGYADTFRWHLENLVRKKIEEYKFRQESYIFSSSGGVCSGGGGYVTGGSYKPPQNRPTL